MKNTGTLRIQTFAARQSAPMEGVTVAVQGDGFTLHCITDATGSAADIPVEAPACTLSLDEDNTIRPYAVVSLTAAKSGYRTVRIEGIQIFAGQITLAQPAMIPVTEEGKDIPDAPIVIPPHPLFAGSGGSGAQPVENCTPRVLDKVIMSAYESSIPPVSIDGKFGADTERAVRAYQRFAGLTVDGVVGRTTWNSLYGRASQLRSSGPVVTLKRLPYPGTPLTVGSSGSAVLYYALLLQRIAYYFSSVEAPPLSDQYTDETAAATRSAQQLLGLEQTGIADADTWTAVEALSLQLAAHAPNPDRDTPPSTAYPGRAIAEGSAGQEVGQVERWLNRRAQLSCGEDYVADNNRFGAADAAAVRAVQQQAGLLVTGIVNRDTWAALQAQSCNCDKEE